MACGRVRVAGGRESEMKVGDERDEGGRWSESVEGGEVGCGLDDVILDIRWNLCTVRARW